MEGVPRRTPKILILALDIGSSSTRTALFDEKARLVTDTEARREYAVQYSSDGGAELSPFLLRKAARSCLRETLHARRSSRLSSTPIAGVGASAFWHSLLGLDRGGRPLTPIFTWADSRCASDALRLRKQFDERKIHAATGCMLRASYWPAKLRWLRRTNRQLFRKIARWVSPADWIFHEIFGAEASSHSMASGTGLYDRRTKSWHEDLLAACDLRIEKLDPIMDSPFPTSFSGLQGSQVFPPLGDGAAGNLGCGADTHGRIAINLGTSAAVRMMENALTAPTAVPFGLFRYDVDRERSVMGGATSNAGNLRRWCQRELRIDGTKKNILSRSASANDALAVLPFWVAERAPTWPENLQGTLVGLTQSTDAAQIYRATTCAVFYRLADILALIEKNRSHASEIIVSGGAAHASATLSLLADALRRDIWISPESEASLRGAAVNVLEKLGYQDRPWRKGKLVRHDERLAEKHRGRRARQAALESVLSDNAKAAGASGT